MERDVLRAILKDQADELSQLISRGADILRRTEKEGWSFLHQALVSLSPSLQVSPDMVRHLVDQGVGVNDIDIYGNSPLHYAARAHHAEAVRELLELGADPNAINKDRCSPLRLAATKRAEDLDTFKYLLQGGADLDEPADSGETVREFIKTNANQPESLRQLVQSY